MSINNECQGFFVRETLNSRGNYIWVKEPRPDDYPSLEQMDLDRWEINTYSGILTLTLTTIQPLHIGSGRIVKKENYLVQEFYNHNGIPVIPGSSLKGCIKHHLTILVGKENVEKIFGSTSHISLVFFSDALSQGNIVPQIGEITERWGPRIKKKDSVKFYQKDSRNTSRKERMLLVPRNSKFKFTISFRNFTEVYLGALFIAMGLDPERPRGFKLGGGKGYGLGLVKLKLDSTESWYIKSAKQLLTKDKRIPVTDNVFTRWINSFWKSLNPRLKKHLICIEENFKNEYGEKSYNTSRSGA